MTGPDPYPSAPPAEAVAAGHPIEPTAPGRAQARSDSLVEDVVAFVEEAKRVREENDQLHEALWHRPEIDQAKGVLMAELGLGPDEAFAALSRRSQDTNVPVRVLCRQVLDTVRHGDRGPCGDGRGAYAEELTDLVRPAPRTRPHDGQDTP